MSGEDIQSRLRTLQASYLDHLLVVEKGLMRHIVRISRNGFEKPDWDNLQSIAHKLAGSAKSYGFAEIGDAARHLERLLDTHDYERHQFKILAYIAELNAKISATLQEGQSKGLVSETSDCNEPEKGPPRHCVLIADDDPHIYELLERLFGDHVDVKIVDNGRDVESAISRFRPDLVLLDDNMPGMRGIDVVRGLSEAGLVDVAPIIMLTANHDPENVMQAIQLGAIDYYTKPFEPVELVEKVRLLLNRRKHSVLVVDDDPTIHSLLKPRFEMKGFHVLSANGGRDALSLLETEQSDLIILDRMMPGMEGGAVLHQIRKDPNLGHIPIIVLTARNARGDAHEWLQRGATDFVLKPFDPDELVLRAMRILDLEKAA